MNSHGVKISIAGCVEEIVRDPNLMPFSFFSFFFLSYFKFCFSLRPKAEVISTKIARIRNSYGLNKLPPCPTHHRGVGNRGRNTPGPKLAPSAPALKTTTKYT